jgi:hypothetical protein
MSIYERKNDPIRKFKSKRPSYYTDYFLNDEPYPKKDNYLWFLIFITVTVFFTAIMNIVFSYMEIDKCQKIEYITTLNKWIRFLGFYGIIYYTFLFLCIYFTYVRNMCESSASLGSNESNYERMYNNYERSNKESNECFFKIFVSIFTIFMVIVQFLVTYSYFQYFNNQCTSYTIILYMWISLLMGILSSIFIIFSVFFFSFE